MSSSKRHHPILGTKTTQDDEFIPVNRLPTHQQLILGPMFSGKTTELMRRIKRYQIAKHTCLVVKYAKDDRYSKEAIATHDQQVLDAVCTNKLNDIKKPHEYSVIGIDEGQFFPDVVDFAEKMANRGIIVIIAALDGTFQRVGFKDFLRLVPLAESVVKLTAVCMICFNEAAFTKRKTSDTEVEVIGGSDKYLATCRNCYFRMSPKKQPKAVEGELEYTSPEKKRQKLFNSS